MQQANSPKTSKTGPKDRLLPYRVLCYLLYAEGRDWIENRQNHTVRLITGDASRFLRLRAVQLWDILYWLEQAKLIERVEKERRRGSAIIHLKKPNRFEEAKV